MKNRIKWSIIFTLLLSQLIIFIRPCLAGINEKRLTERLIKAFSERENYFRYTTETGIDDIEKDRILEAINRARNSSSDYIQYTLRDINLKVKGNRDASVIIFNIEHLSSKREDKYVYNRVDEIIANINQRALNIHQLEKAINDYVVRELKYDESLKHVSPYQALIKGQTTCRGYTLLTYQLLKRAGIESKIIRGRLKESDEGHAWNLVKIEGNWYHLDVTQNDVADNTPDRTMQYRWYNLTDKEMEATHSWKKSDYPAASQEYLQTLLDMKRYNPYNSAVYQKLIKNLNLHYLQDEYTVMSSTRLKNILQKSLKNRDREISFRINRDIANVGQLRRILIKLYKENPKLAQLAPLKSFNINSFPYDRDKYSNTIIARVKFKYN